MRGVRVLGHVLHRFQAGEVHGRLDLLGASPDPVGMDIDRHHRLASLGLQRRREPLVGEQRRIDAARQVSQVLERVVGLGLDVGQHRLGLRGIAIHQGFRQTLLHRQRHQLLLRPVVDVALQGLRPHILRGDDAATRLAKVLDQPDVAQHEPGLRGDVGHQTFTIGSQRFGRRRHDADRTEQFAAVTDGERPLPVGERREVLIGTAPAKDRRGRRAVGPGRRGPELRTHGEPHGGALGADPFGQTRGPDAAARRRWSRSRSHARRSPRAPRTGSRACRTPRGWPAVARAHAPVGRRRPPRRPPPPTRADCRSLPTSVPTPTTSPM